MGHFLPLTSPVLVILTGFLACTFRKVWSTSTLKCFCRCSYIFEITIYPLMDKWFPLLTPKHSPKHSSWWLNDIKYWSLFVVEYLQPNKLKEKPNVNPIYHVSCFSSLGNASCLHVFPEKDRLSLFARGKRIMFSGKKYNLSG